MTRIWATQPETTFSLIGINMYLVEFTSEKELLRIMNRGVWTYREEVVTIQRIRGSADLIRPHVRNLDVWVQWHGIPLEEITKQGLLEISTKVGKPKSDVYEAFANGKKFFRIKMMIPVDAKLKQNLTATHPILGPLNIYLVYEKLTKVCLFCAKIGHNRLDCPDKIRMESLREDPRFANSPELDNIPEIRVGAWINNQAYLPISNSQIQIPNQSNANNPNPIPQTQPYTDIGPGTVPQTQFGPLQQPQPTYTHD